MDPETKSIDDFSLDAISNTSDGSRSVSTVRVGSRPHWGVGGGGDGG